MVEWISDHYLYSGKQIAEWVLDRFLYSGKHIIEWVLDHFLYTEKQNFGSGKVDGGVDFESLLILGKADC